MAGDGSGGGKASLEWSADPVVRSYQSFARGFCQRDEPTFIDHLYFRLPGHRAAESALEEALALPSGARAEHCLKVCGGSRAGKTTLHREFVRKYPAHRDRSGLHIPYAYMETPAVPSPSLIDQTILEALGDPTWQSTRGPVARLAQIVKVADQLELRALGIDDLQHLVDTRGERVQHASADRLKEIGFRLKVPFVFSGLDRMEAVFNTNEQAQGRAHSTIGIRRLDWTRTSDKKDFSVVVQKVVAEFDRHVGKSEFDSNTESEVFRLYVSVGGLVGNLFRVMRVAAVDCIRTKSPLSNPLLRRAVLRVIARQHSWPHGHDPFHPEFVKVAATESLATALRLGSGEGPGTAQARKLNNGK